MGYDLLMQHFRTPAVLAEALSALGERITPQAIYKWKRKGIPLDRAPQIEVVSSGVLKCEALCPQVEWVRGEDGQVIGYSVSVSPPDDPEHKNFQPCRVGLALARVFPTANPRAR
jgi:DNA-binding transcriptional regulator YdaS (Cro superfamily)